MKLKQFAFLIAAFLPATAIGASERLSIDVVVANPDGSVSVDRTSSWPDFNGGIVDVTQRLKQDDFGRLSYRYEDQSRATQLYHQAYCESVEMTPSSGTMTLSGPSTGWSCYSDDPAPPADPVNSIDWATATAPSGRVPVGQSIFPIGSGSWESSIGGMRRSTLSVDNGRCIAQEIDHYAGPFRGRTQFGVNCYFSQSKFANTMMETCIPKQCATNRGTIFAQ